MLRRLALALPLALAAGWAAGAADPAPAAPRLEPVACWFSDTGKPAARCYRFHVPENRARPVGRRTVTLPVVVLPAGDDRRAGAGRIGLRTRPAKWSSDGFLASNCDW